MRMRTSNGGHLQHNTHKRKIVYMFHAHFELNVSNFLRVRMYLLVLLCVCSRWMLSKVPFILLPDRVQCIVCLIPNALCRLKGFDKVSVHNGISCSLHAATAGYYWVD